jgi:hypothetical protein
MIKFVKETTGLSGDEIKYQFIPVGTSSPPRSSQNSPESSFLGEDFLRHKAYSTKTFTSTYGSVNFES